mmetsp:Transcript_8688/g.19013  ORF Transcript_8688/g.19013 Transcript_8688/m.19013 type:complete len:211 (+) Transcript_8688:739-1371(+)
MSPSSSSSAPCGIRASPASTSLLILPEDSTLWMLSSSGRFFTSATTRSRQVPSTWSHMPTQLALHRTSQVSPVNPFLHPWQRPVASHISRSQLPGHAKQTPSPVVSLRPGKKWSLHWSGSPVLRLQEALVLAGHFLSHPSPYHPDKHPRVHVPVAWSQTPPTHPSEHCLSHCGAYHPLTHLGQSPLSREQLGILPPASQFTGQGKSQALP